MPRQAAHRDLLLAFGAFALAFVLWQFRPFSPVVYPLRLFVTFVHELGHGTTAIITGGRFIEFEVQSSGAGLAYSSGGVRPLVIMMGYVGTAIFGSALLYFTRRSSRPEYIAIGLGVTFTILTLLFAGLALSNLSLLELFILLIGFGGASYLVFMRQKPSARGLGLGLMLGSILLTVRFAADESFLTVIVGVLSGAALVAVGYAGLRGYREVVLFTLYFLAFAVGLNAITDAWFLFRIVTTPDLMLHNDASSMARETGLPAAFWAGTWIILAVVMLGSTTWLTFIRPVRKG